MILTNTFEQRNNKHYEKFFLTAFCCLAFVGFGAAQSTLNLTQDLVLTETLVFDENTNVIGNGFKIICNGCDPMIKVESGAQVDFQNVIFARGYTSWMSAASRNNTSVTWDSPRMRGFITWSEN